MQTLETPQARTDFISGVSDPLQQSRLSTLATALQAQERARQAEVDLLKQKKIAELTAPAEFYATPEGAASWKNELARIREESLAKYAGLRSPSTQPKAPSFWESIQPADRVKIVTSQGQVSTIRDLANTFEKMGGNALTLQTQSKLNPQSPENLALAKLNILVPSTARLMGEVGNLAQPEQERLINATLGSIISGPKAIAARLRQLADTAEGIINSKTTAYKAAFETGGEAMLPDGITTSAVDAKLKKLAELKAQLAELKAKRGAP